MSTHPGAVDTGTRNETTVNLAQQVQVAFHVTYGDITGENCRPGKLTTSQRVVAPEHGRRALIDALHRTVGLAQVDAAIAERDARVGRSIALPENPAAFQIKCSQT